jgi:bile acid-coenzyme A ligase
MTNTAPRHSLGFATDGSEELLPLGVVLAHHAAEDPDRPALTTEGRTWTRAQLDARSTQRARMLAARGVQAGDFVTLALPNGLEFYETTFAIWKLGAIPNVVSHKLPDVELHAIIDLVDPSLVVGVDPARLGGRRGVPAGVPLDQTLSTEPLPAIVARSWKAMTSGGSTGRPKVILDGMDSTFNIRSPLMLQQPGDVALNPGPLYHNAPFISMMSVLASGGHVVDMPRFDAESALELIGRHKVQWVNFVPTMLHRMMRLPDEVRAKADLSSLRVMFHMAAPCPAWLKEAWIDWIGAERIYELYAGTERQGATVIRGDEWQAKRGSVGRCAPGYSLRILDEDRSELPVGEIGEIYFLPDAGQGATYSYIGADPKTAGAWESLGDLGWLDEDGYLFLADRRTDLILSGGANIYPAEVEAALDSHPEVQSSAVIGLKDDDLGRKVHALVQRREGSTLDAEALLSFLGLQLARYKVPRSIEFTDQPLRDDAGKVRRSALAAERE